MSVKTGEKDKPPSGSNGRAKKSGSAVGAPAQHNQGSRKGKKAWRKHIDIEDVEEGMEGLRTEERITGSILQKKKDEELFQIDTKGDERVRRSLPKFSTSLLTSTKILSQRSAVPAVFSRATGSNSITGKRKLKLSCEEKDRLLRMGKRPRKGPFGAVLDTDEMGSGSAMLEVSDAAKASGTYDVWGEKGKYVEGPKVKQPKTHHPREFISLAAVPTPHEGASYNPLVTSHQELLLSAVEIEERRAKEAGRLEEMRNKVEEMRKASAAADEEGLAPGMMLDEVREEDAEEDQGDSVGAGVVKKAPERKTKQQRRKAEQLRAEKRALAEKLARKRMLASVEQAKALRKTLGKTAAIRERLRAQRHEASRAKLSQGLAGQKLGKHKVPEDEVDVQLSEDLTESLRTLKPEGNLFKDRFLNMQHRALIEPRAPVLPGKRRAKTKEYEKHAWKRFDREH